MAVEKSLDMGKPPAIVVFVPKMAKLLRYKPDLRFPCNQANMHEGIPMEKSSLIIIPYLLTNGKE